MRQTQVLALVLTWFCSAGGAAGLLELLSCTPSTVCVKAVSNRTCHRCVSCSQSPLSGSEEVCPSSRGVGVLMSCGCVCVCDVHCSSAEPWGNFCPGRDDFALLGLGLVPFPQVHASFRSHVWRPRRPLSAINIFR